jgi:acetyl esterase
MPAWRDLIAAVEAMSAEEYAAHLPPSPSTGELASYFPQLAAVQVESVTIDGPHGDVPARLYRPDGPAAAVLVWVHGGAFVFGDLDMPEAHWVGLGLAARGLAVLSVEYRKCLRGVHFPVPSDDVLAAWLWAVASSNELAGQVHLGGSSAGGNLAAGVAKRLRDGAGPVPASLVLAYPVLHHGLPAPSEELQAALTRFQPSITFTPEAAQDMNLQFVGSEDLLSDPYAFAGNGDVSGQPPVYILNSEADTLRMSGELYAEQLRASGVDVTVEFEPGTQHGQLNEPFTLGGQRSLERIAGWLHETTR